MGVIGEAAENALDFVSKAASKAFGVVTAVKDEWDDHKRGLLQEVRKLHDCQHIELMSLWSDSPNNLSNYLAKKGGMTFQYNGVYFWHPEAHFDAVHANGYVFRSIAINGNKEMIGTDKSGQLTSWYPEVARKKVKLKLCRLCIREADAKLKRAEKAGQYVR